eukprot:g3463.t1
MKSLIKLDITSSPLQELPANFVSNHKRLVVLRIMKTNLKKLPVDIGNLKDLINLWISDSKVETLPSSIGKIKNLKGLILSRNKLKALPDSIVNLVNLSELWLNGNEISVLPKHFETQLNMLSTLYIQNNKLTELPLSQMLYTILAWNNKFTYIPDDIGEIASNIYVLDVRNNNISTHLPYSIRKLNEHLAYLYMAGNPICKTSKYVDMVMGSDEILSTEAQQTLCKQQCAVNCPSIFLGDAYCDDDEEIYEKQPVLIFSNNVWDVKPASNNSKSCNSENCNYDDNDCSI